ncbi:MAG TPA: carboxylating nicotinate-nucleotide diphosphorylase [Nitrososphaeraceae archaeon]|nr:carboxylating nicotinate-nucleotide diphosphorylase [Nitrososphaeraceae archaeon]
MKKLSDHLNLRNSLLNFLQEDVGVEDITSNNLKNFNKQVKADIIYKSDFIGILCGLEEVEMLFDICNCNSKYIKSDGMSILPKEKIIEINGKAKDILKAERTALNLLMRMSGISTLTRKFVNIINQIDQSISIASTRKTVPGLRLLDKKAVVIGGGVSHRIRLDDMVMIKDNHLVVDKSIREIISSIRERIGSSKNIECEVKNENEAIEAIESGANIIMLDNFSVLDAKKTILKINQLGLRHQVKIEISGGINLENVIDYAKLKPDIISIGYLTHSARSLDFSLKIRNN